MFLNFLKILFSILPFLICWYYFGFVWIFFWYLFYYLGNHLDHHVCHANFQILAIINETVMQNFNLLLLHTKPLNIKNILILTNGVAWTWRRRSSSSSSSRTILILYYKGEVFFCSSVPAATPLRSVDLPSEKGGLEDSCPKISLPPHPISFYPRKLSTTF